MSKNIDNQKVVLAFSGGLDTSFCVVYLKNNNYDVITVTVDTGGFSAKEIAEIEDKSKTLGAVQHYFIDAKQDLYERYITYTIKGNILRGSVYPLSASCERYVQAGKVIEIAKNLNITKIAHGSTGAGNDQVRFHVTIKALYPESEILTPIRDLGLSRAEETKYLEKYGFSVPQKTSNYSINKGFLGNTIGGKETLNSWDCPPDDIYPDSSSLENTPDDPEIITIGFENGQPKTLNGETMNPITILQKLIGMGNKHGIGRDIHLGNTILGIKGRVAFEAPAAIILTKAHRELEKLVLTKWQLFWKDQMANVYGDLLHEGQFFDPVMRDIEAMFDNSQKYVIGDVRIKLYKGNVIIQGVSSPFTLMDPKIGTYGEKNVLWTSKDAEGFCKIYGLQGIIAYNIHDVKG